MERKKVKSSNINSIGWKDNILEIEFHNGGIYQYKNVNEEIYKAFMDVESKGKYFSQYIKGIFTSDKVSPDFSVFTVKKLKELEFINYDSGLPETLVYADTVKDEMKKWKDVLIDGCGIDADKCDVLRAFISHVFG